MTVTSIEPDLVGRAAVSFYFLWSAWFNVIHRRQNAEELARVGIVRAGPIVVAAGTAMMTAAALAFLHPRGVFAGGVALMAFTWGADALYHRWWLYPDRGERVVHQQFACEHLALNGGILGLMLAG